MGMHPTLRGTYEGKVASLAGRTDADDEALDRSSRWS